MTASFDNFWLACDRFALQCGRRIEAHWDQFSRKASEIAEKLKPLAETAYQAGLALYTLYTTSQVCISILPIVLGSITLFAATPFFSELSTPITYLSVFSISTIAAYVQYRELVSRQALDDQIRSNQEVTQELRKELTAVKKQLESLKPSSDSSIQETPKTITTKAITKPHPKAKKAAQSSENSQKLTI